MIKNITSFIHIVAYVLLIAAGIYGYNQISQKYDRMKQNIIQSNNELVQEYQYTAREMKQFRKAGNNELIKRMDSIADEISINKKTVNEYTTIEKHYHSADTTQAETETINNPGRPEKIQFSDKNKCWGVQGFVLDTNVFITKKESYDQIDIIRYQNRQHWWQFWKEKYNKIKALSECGDSLKVRKIKVR